MLRSAQFEGDGGWLLPFSHISLIVCKPKSRYDQTTQTQLTDESDNAYAARSKG